jgi:hypothetical protein
MFVALSASLSERSQQIAIKFGIECIQANLIVVPLSCHFHCFKYRYFPRHFVFKQPQSMSSFRVPEQISQP